MHETWACYAPGRDFLRIVDELQSQARNRLQLLVPPRFRKVGKAVLATAWGDPSDEILKYAREHNVDLIVCGTHGRRGWDLVAMGSVAARLVRLASCPVLTVRGSTPPAEAAA
jgi:universal stress protein A